MRPSGRREEKGPGGVWFSACPIRRLRDARKGGCGGVVRRGGIELARRTNHARLTGNSMRSMRAGVGSRWWWVIEVDRRSVEVRCQAGGICHESAISREMPWESLLILGQEVGLWFSPARGRRAKCRRTSTAERTCRPHDAGPNSCQIPANNHAACCAFLPIPAKFDCFFLPLKARNYAENERVRKRTEPNSIPSTRTSEESISLDFS